MYMLLFCKDIITDGLVFDCDICYLLTDGVRERINWIGGDDFLYNGVGKLQIEIIKLMPFTMTLKTDFRCNVKRPGRK